MNWTRDQKRIIDARNCNLLVSAAAGSGKTAVLVERIIQMVSDKNNPINIDELLVVTFTKAAAAQMKEKIARAIEKQLEDEPENEHFLKQVNLINKANILTIDSFCYQVVKEHFHVLGIDPGIQIGEAADIGLLREEILEEIIEENYKNSTEFVAFSDAFSGDKSDENVEDYILKIYNVSSSYPRPKEWIKNALSQLHIETQEEFVKLSFVTNYFAEIKNTALGIKNEILEALELARGLDGPIYMEKALLEDIVLINDIISAKNYTQYYDLSLAKFANIGRGKKGTFDEEIAEKIKTMRDNYKKSVKSLLSAFVVPFEAVLSQLNEQEKMFSALLKAADSFRDRFLEAKLERGLLEFSDVEHFALQVLCKDYDEEGNPIPSNIGAEMAEGFSEILIDEYQDSNYLQEAILSCVSTVSQGKNNIFMVGDVKQSIYSFRMARPDLFMDKFHSYPDDEKAVCRKLLLKNNFRSRANVLQTINYIFYQIMGADLGGIEYTKEEELVPGREFLEGVDDSVEFLLGESKDFEFLEEDDGSALVGVKDENLDENLEDISKMELEATMVANRICEMMGSENNEPLKVTDDVTGTLRNVTYGDIVILFRAPRSYQQIFSEILTGHNIPVKVQNENGYFDTTEISVLLSLLRVLDNPFNDLELVAVLRSYFGDFSNDELAILAIMKRKTESQQKNKMPFYKFMEQVIQNPLYNIDLGIENEKEVLDIVYDKIRRVMGLLQGLEEEQNILSISEQLTKIYYDLGYYYFVEAMPEGLQKARNLDLFLTEANRFCGNGYRSVFDFIRYIDKLLKKAIVLGGDPGTVGTENVVRIMSIHKSKGLEFPVVFLAGTGKNFNLMDAKAKLIVHSDYYLGGKYVDNTKRCGNDTFQRKAFCALMTTESIAEELRILYVALTRAKEKLIMTGVTNDIPALVSKYAGLAKRQDEKLSFAVVHTAKNYLDLIVAAFIRNDSFYQAMCNVKNRFDEKTKEIISAEYETPYKVKLPNVRLQVLVYDFKEIAHKHLNLSVDNQLNRVMEFEKIKALEAVNFNRINENLMWRYPDEIYTKQKSKMSVTEIKRIYETDYEPSDVIEQPITDLESYKAPLPLFIAGQKVMDAAQKGTWIHKIMELVNNGSVDTLEKVEQTLEGYRKEGRIPEETKDFATAQKIYNMLSSSLGKRMKTADLNGKLYKEKQFVVGVPADNILRESESVFEANEQSDIYNKIVVQGIVDAYFEEQDYLVLVDYKTDFIKSGMEQILIDRYRTQLLYYKDTLEKLTGIPVKETYLYSFALDKEIFMDCKL